MGKERMALEVINNSAYNEFPDIITTIQISMWFAKNELRSVPEAMRHTARECLKRAVNPHLRRTLLDMSSSIDPTLEMANLYICQLKMRDELAEELKGKVIRQRDLNHLRKL